jgi:hypothetical protein
LQLRRPGDVLPLHCQSGWDRHWSVGSDNHIVGLGNMID